MTKHLRIVAALAVVVAVVAALNRSAAQDEKNPTIKEIMTKAHKGGNSLIQTVGKELKGKDIDWAHVREHTEDLVKLGKALNKNQPPRGEKESWDKLTKTYQETATALDTAVAAKNQKDAQTAHSKLSKSCKTCHDSHKK